MNQTSHLQNGAPPPAVPRCPLPLPFSGSARQPHPVPWIPLPVPCPGARGRFFDGLQLPVWFSKKNPQRFKEPSEARKKNTNLYKIRINKPQYFCFRYFYSTISNRLLQNQLIYITHVKKKRKFDIAVQELQKNVSSLFIVRPFYLFILIF